MSKELLTMQDTASPQQIFEAIKEKRVPVMPIIKNTGELAGVLTAKGCMRATIYTPAQNAQRQLLTAVAVGVNAQTKDKVRKLVELGVDVIVLDMAHGYQKKMIETIKGVREVIGPDRILVAGNVVTAEATRDFIHAGVNIVKVGVGPGAMCTTRMMTGMGRPQFSAVRACSEVARSMGAHVWADGNIKQPRDVSLALAAGASCAFFGSWFTGTYESPADIKRDEQGRLYKENFGMASRRAVIDRTRSYEVFDQERKQYFEEGISASKMYLKPGEESAEDIIDKITAGVRSACTYAGARNLEEFYEKVVVGTQTQAGFIEGKPWEESW
jgi:IMP dehydrogenase